MIINQKQLKKVAVETQSGQFLGYVTGFELETDTGVIEKYYVKSKMVLTGLWGNSLIINKSQIINFDEEKMVVEDAAVRFQAGIRRKISEVNLEGTEPVISSEANNQ